MTNCYHLIRRSSHLVLSVLCLLHTKKESTCIGIEISNALKAEKYTPSLKYAIAYSTELVAPKIKAYRLALTDIISTTRVISVGRVLIKLCSLSIAKTIIITATSAVGM